MKVLPVLLSERPEVCLRIAEHRLRQEGRCARANRLAADMVLPRAPLRKHKHRAATARAYPLIMTDRTVIYFVPVSELFFDLYQVFDVQARCKRRAAAPAGREVFSLPHVLVKAHAKLRGSLKDVKELSERKPQQCEYNRYRMEYRQKVEGVPLHPGVAGRQHQTCDADGEKQDERQEVFAELLENRGLMIAHAAAHREHNTRDDEKRGPYKAVEDHKAEYRIYGKRERGKPENIGPVPAQIVGQRLEMYPPEDERERDGDSNHASPHDEPVSSAPQLSSSENEEVERELARDAAEPGRQIARDMTGPKEDLPPALPVERGRRSL